LVRRAGAGLKLTALDLPVLTKPIEELSAGLVRQALVARGGGFAAQNLPTSHVRKRINGDRTIQPICGYIRGGTIGQCAVVNRPIHPTGLIVATTD